MVIPNQVARLRSLYRNPRFLAFLLGLAKEKPVFLYGMGDEINLIFRFVITSAPGGFSRPHSDVGCRIVRAR